MRGCGAVDGDRGLGPAPSALGIGGGGGASGWERTMCGVVRDTRGERGCDEIFSGAVGWLVRIAGRAPRQARGIGGWWVESRCGAGVTDSRWGMPPLCLRHLPPEGAPRTGDGVRGEGSGGEGEGRWWLARTLLPRPGLRGRRIRGCGLRGFRSVRRFRGGWRTGWRRWRGRRCRWRLG